MASPAPLHVHPHFNAEEAAAAATEFVASLDNLPAEVCFLLNEIKEKDIRIQQLVHRISSRHQGLTKSARSTSTSTPPTPTPSFPLPLPPNTPLPTAHLSNKDAVNLNKIQTEWTKIMDLQEEKIKLAERLERIVNRARERGRAEWRRVGGMDLDELESSENKFMDLGGAEVVLPPTGLGSGTDRATKKRTKPSTLSLPQPTSAPVHPSIAMPPPSAPTPATVPTPVPPTTSHTSTSHGAGTSGSGRSSLSGRTGRAARGHERHESISTTMSDADADGEFEVPEPGEGDADDGPYCFCQQRSYGEMVGCDNDKCRYEWFHTKCVDVVPPLPDTWYCPECVQLLGFASSDGRLPGQKEKKGRKK